MNTVKRGTNSDVLSPDITATGPMQGPTLCGNRGGCFHCNEFRPAVKPSKRGELPRVGVSQ